MSDAFTKHYERLNQHQKEAVDSIDGPLLVLAGPGTGKTELLSMRAASILEKTDTLPSSILCLTFTESGAVAMRERLRSIIGADAYKVAIHTFHGFGTEIINQNGEYFYRGANFRPADSLTQYNILREIFDELPHGNPLASKNRDIYTYLSDAQKVISELKRSGLTSDELRSIISSNETVLDEVESEITAVFEARISKSTAEKLAPLAQKVARVDQPKLPGAHTPYANILALSIAHAVDEAIEADSTKPITAWKNTWLEKDASKNLVMKDRRRHDRLRAVVDIYYQYMNRMEAAGLYDYDDMILEVIHALETQPDLQANLQERYLYIMVDEFQDTNLAQLRLLYDIAGDSPETANVMAVGDDDQAIYSFQGADSSNVHNFRTHFGDPKVVVLTDNYRSNSDVLSAARKLITLGSDRLENSIEGLSKELTAHRQDDERDVSISQYPSAAIERYEIARSVQKKIADGVNPSEIAILARRHHELAAIMPYLNAAGIAVNYERRDNALDHEVVRIVEKLLRMTNALEQSRYDEIDSLLPEILAHPGFGYQPADIYRLSLNAWRDRHPWFALMQLDPRFKPFADWLLVRSGANKLESIEQQIDELLGTAEHDEGYHSPLHDYYFSGEKRQQNPSAYLEALEALRTIRDAIREHFVGQEPTVEATLEFIDMHRQLDLPLVTVRQRSAALAGHAQLMTVHKSKGLEFDHVYVMGAVENVWGEKVRERSRLISYPANLKLAPAGGNYDERIRLFYVAMTRARQSLALSYSSADTQDKPLLAASFVGELGIEPTVHSDEISLDEMTDIAEIDWRKNLTADTPAELSDLLASTLESYKLSSTHLGNFIDVASGGPQHFLLNNLLRFPQAKSASADYGTAIHQTLQRAHNAFQASGEKRALEDILGDFERNLRELHLPGFEFDRYLTRGMEALTAFLSEKYQTFSTNQRTELNFANQGVVIEGARLTGSADLVDLNREQKTIVVTDYKTGKPSRDWRGRTEFEKIKLHKYRYQLMFYQLLAENSRDYSGYEFSSGVLQFVEPSQSGDILALEEKFSDDELSHLKKLINAVWQAIMKLDFPDTSDYEPTLAGIKDFEKAIIDKYSTN